MYIYIYHNKSLHKLTIVLNVSPSPEEFHKTGVTIRLVVLFLECSFVELLQAEGTNEMFRVELLAHGSDTPAGDGLLTAGTQRAALGVVVGLAVG